MFTKEDLDQLSKKGINPEVAQGHIERFQKGFPFIKLDAPALVSSGILQLGKKELDYYVTYFEENSGQLGILKFVPASGAATRMFKDLFTWRDKISGGLSVQELVKSDLSARDFLKNIRRFAFWDDLAALLKEKGIDPDDIIKQQDMATIITYLLDDDGLGYAELPKGLLKFHKYDEGVRTPVEEHLVEGAHYACDNDSTVKLHFTVSSEHRGRFVNHVGDVLKHYEDFFGLRFEIKFSAQKPSTDTLAVDPENKPFRDVDGSLLFRPGGHGALIQNLNEIKEDVVFIKNIDNIVPDSLKETTYTYKKALGGMLIEYQEKIHTALITMEDGTFSDDDYAIMRRFAIDKLFFDPALLPEVFEEGRELMGILFNRPMRICGMVKNVGEPGGGPFWVENTDDGTRSLQIVESSQVNQNDPEQKAVFDKATHFNPVDLVCGLKDHHGEAFDLTQFVDTATGFISHKSKDGKELKALELPGLWNGAMADWITIFVEVPLLTFNPVKTVMDLLRKEHL